MRPRYADLFRRLRDPDPTAADAAFDAILFDRGEAVPDIVECYLKSSRDDLTRFDMIQLLGFSESRDSIPTLLQALHDRSAQVRAEACRSLEDLRAAEAIEALGARLQDVDEDVRIAAREALDKILSVP
jgi:HEAT repeat protein